MRKRLEKGLTNPIKIFDNPFNGIFKSTKDLKMKKILKKGLKKA